MLCRAAHGTSAEDKRVQRKVLEVIAHLHAQFVTPIRKDKCPQVADHEQFLEAAKKDTSMLVRIIRALATGETGPIDAEAEDEEWLVPFICKEMIQKLRNPRNPRVDTLHGYIAQCSDVMSQSGFKHRLRKLRMSADYQTIRVKKNDEIKLEPDATTEFMTENGDIIIVTFDNVGFHIGGKHCG